MKMWWATPTSALDVCLLDLLDEIWILDMDLRRNIFGRVRLTRMVLIGSNFCWFWVGIVQLAMSWVQVGGSCWNRLV